MYGLIIVTLLVVLAVIFKIHDRGIKFEDQVIAELNRQYKIDMKQLGEWWIMSANKITAVDTLAITVESMYNHQRINVYANIDYGLSVELNVNLALDRAIATILEKAVTR